MATTPEERWRRVPGTLVFADVSGFTPLTERLARRGKVGAEELTDVLNDVFSRLLTVAESYGGDLLKFGGDALLLLFDGEGHERRAAAAAIRLLEALHPFSDFRTPGGRLSLSMSIGVDSGDIDLFLVGGSSRELLVAGDVASSTVLMEHAALAGEVLCGPGTVAALLPEALGDAKAGGRLLLRSPDALPAEAPASEIPPEIAAILVPSGLRGHLSRPQRYGEHRLAGLSFLQFSGVDRLLRADGARAVADALGEIVASAQAACDRYGVTFLATDVDADGGKMLFTAGAPAARADDADRLLHALLASVRTDTPIDLRAGANFGRAFAVDVGSSTRRTYAVMGDATNLAARVMGRAKPGQVVVTQSHLDHVRDSFRKRRLEPFAVKGKSAPVIAAVVSGVAGSRRTSSTGGDIPFIGRSDELEVVNDALRGARSGTGARIRIVGPPGIGKSSLVRKISARATGFTRFTIDGSQYAMDSAYFCLRRPLRGLLYAKWDAPEHDVAARLTEFVKARAPHLQPWLPLLGIPWGCTFPESPATQELEPDNRRQRLQDVVVEALTLLLDGPTLVLVEDAHWVDDASASALTQLTRDISNQPWCVVTTRRPTSGGFSADDTGWRHLELAPLPAGAVEQALDDLPEMALQTGARRELVRRSGGNPLFLRELVAAVNRGEDLATLPESVEGVLAASIDELAPDDRALVQLASVLGTRFPAADLVALTADDDSAAARLDTLPHYLQTGSDGVVHFQHALIRDVAYESLPFGLRRQLHARAGAAIEHRTGGGDEVLDLLSMHYHLAQQDEQTWRFARAAGQKSLQSMAAAEAVVHLQRAIDAGRRLSAPATEVAVVAESLGDALEVCGRYGEAGQALSRATRGVTDPLTKARLLRKQGRVRERASRYTEALRWYTRAERVISELPATDETRANLAQLRMSYAAARLAQGRYGDAIPMLKEAAEHAEAVHDLDTLAHAYYLLDWALTDIGSEERHHYRDLALPIFEQTGNLVGQGFCLNNLGIDAYWEGRWDDALSYYERVRAVCERSGDVITDATVLNNIGEIQSDRASYDAAERSFRRAITMMSSGRAFPVGIAIATSNLGRLATRRGDFAAAAALLSEARDRFAAIGSEALGCETDAREAERLLLADDRSALELASLTQQRAERIAGLRVVVIQLELTMLLARAHAGDLSGAASGLSDLFDRAVAESARYEAATIRYVQAALAPALGDAATGEAMAIAAGNLLDGLGVAAVPPALDLLLRRVAAPQLIDLADGPQVPGPRRAERSIRS